MEEPITQKKIILHHEGLEVGAVTVKWVSISEDGKIFNRIVQHGGNPKKVIQKILDAHEPDNKTRIVVTGQASRELFNLPYRSEPECFEKALEFYDLKPDILLSLGGESFSIYPMKDGTIKNIISSSKCAAGTGEFIVQQFQRMGMSLEQGMEDSRSGKIVPLATRCSVHCKSDATHKLNKGECTPGDIAKSLISDLAKKVGEMVELSQWPNRSMVIAGGVSKNPIFMEKLRQLFPNSCIEVLPESHCLEAFGASLFARDLLETPLSSSQRKWLKSSGAAFETLNPLKDAEALLDYRVRDYKLAKISPDHASILGIDAGSTTTKAVLFDVSDNSVVAACYLRTLGNPVLATKRCLQELIKQIGKKSIRIVQAGATGSARELVSVYLNNCLSFNEILAHARAATQEVPKVDTVFEIGGQDSKFISFQNGIPVDYAMNEGCSAGTGSFLEESASVDMGVEMKDISEIAERSLNPIAFGERCAAFINTDLRNALQQGASQEDVIAGLVYSIADNYTSRIVGSRHIGENLLFLGGVALNRSVALAMAARTGRKIVVPPHPELMGAVGTALLAKDQLTYGYINEEDYCLPDLLKGEMEVKSLFRCKTCNNRCEIQRIAVRGKTYPFGGLCSKYERQRHGKEKIAEGRDLVALRNQLMFEEYGPQSLEAPHGTIGLPMALSTYELFPFYARLINELGYEVVLSKPSKIGNTKTGAAICYPCEIVHGAVYDLLSREVDYIFLPYVIELDIPSNNSESYTCPSTTVIPDLIRAAFDKASKKLLSPHIGLSDALVETTLKEIENMGLSLGIEPKKARLAGEKALKFFREFQEQYKKLAERELKKIEKEPTVIIAGRPYTICSPEVNLALPRKITSRGYHAVPVDMLSAADIRLPTRDVWHFTQQISRAISQVKKTPELNICLVSCFSCGPDSSMYHSFRRELAGNPFCYLEIDSHTAHAGFETRVGAFLDIVEERRRKHHQHDNRLIKTATLKEKARLSPKPARFSENFDFIMDSNGRKIAVDDPRVAHILTNNTNPLTGKILAALYEKYGRKCRIIGETNPEIMQYAKKICSGRECIPMTAMAGAALKDALERTDDHELSLYFSLNQKGPCQNGAWPLVWETIAERHSLKNVIGGVNVNTSKNRLGLAAGHVLGMNNAAFLGDFFLEAENTLKCLALEKKSALGVFELEFNKFVRRFCWDEKPMETVLQQWVEKMSEIPLRIAVEEAPKVLIFGGLNLIFVHYPVTEYFLDQGIIPKVVDVAEGFSWLESEEVIRCGFKHGFISPEEQFSASIPKTHRQDAVNARKSRLGIKKIDTFQKNIREIMGQSGLLFDHHIAFPQLIQEGHRYVSNNGFTETTVTTGRYVSSINDGLYDGLVNLGSFNCQPAMNSQGIIRPLANRDDVPYVAIDCEGPWLSTNQRRLLEAVAVQAKRLRKKKNSGIKLL